MLELDDRAMEILSTCISYRGIELLNALKSYLSTEPSPDDIEKIFGFRRSPITITKLILEIVERFTKESIDVIPHIHRKLCLWLIDELKSTFKTFRKSKDLGKIKLIERYLKKLQNSLLYYVQKVLQLTMRIFLLQHQQYLIISRFLR